MSKRSRDRQLAKLAARRAAQRYRKRRQRLLAAAMAALVAVGGIGFGLFSLVAGAPDPAATPSPSASPTPTPAVVACGGKVPKAASKRKPEFNKPPKTVIDRSKTYTMKMVTSCGTIRIRLDQKSAPKTVNSLVFLARRGFFNGQLFHRTVADFVIQGGDPLTAGGGDPALFGTGGPGYKTTDKPPKGAKYPAGTMAMAKGAQEPPGTSGSQFFIVTAPGADDALAPGGEGLYAIVGKVVKGIDIAVMIEGLPRVDAASDGRPAQDVYIVKVTIEEG
jgi:cyclophilin family peptidyl-prolyl cis-trans isomerase